MLSIGPVDETVELFHAQDALFAKNAGQWAADDAYFGYNQDGTQIYFTDEGLQFGLSRTASPASDLETLEIESTRFSLSFDGATPTVPTGTDQAETIFNYHVGAQESWVDGVSTYKTIVYDDLYNGIDLHTFSRHGQIKYEFHVSPGSDYSQIELSYDGIAGLSIDADGSLHIATELGELVDESLYVYQMISGQEVEVEGQFTLLDADTYTFTITGDYDPSVELVIDPSLDWGTYLGGSEVDCGYNIDVDASSNILMTGWTNSTEWVTDGFSTDYNGGTYDAFVVKLDATGSHLWSTYLGGDSYERGFGIAVDVNDNVFISGETRSTGWVSGGYDTSFNLGVCDAFVVKLDAAGSHLWSTYLGGDSYDLSESLAVDTSGNVLISGSTRSSGWVADGNDTTFNGGTSDPFVVKLSADGDHLWSTYLGGSGYDEGLSIAVDAEDNALVTGFTASYHWISDGFDTTYNGGDEDAFVVKLDTAGNHLWSTFLGGTASEEGVGIAVDDSNNVLISGWTASSGWVEDGDDTTYNGGASDAFVVKLAAAGDHLWSTYVGGTGEDKSFGIRVNPYGDSLMTGVTESTGWTSYGIDSSFGGNADGFVAKISGEGQHLWSSYLGGDDYDRCYGVAIDASDNVLLSGYTASSDLFPDDEEIAYLGGTYDAIIFKIDDDTVKPNVNMDEDAAVMASAVMFTVTYSDDIGISVESIDSNDIKVTGPNGYSQLATLVSTNKETDGTPRTATYRITPPATKWAQADNGTYQITLIANEVRDTSGNPIATQALGNFEIFVLPHTLLVDADANPDGDGFTWETAYHDLQLALDEADDRNRDGDSTNNVDSIWIAEGTYYPTLQQQADDARSATFSLLDGVTLYGGFASTELTLAERDPVVYTTTLSGDIGTLGDKSDNAYSVVYCGEDIQAAIDGFGVINGNANISEHGYPEMGYGGGIFNIGSFTALNCVVSNNLASSGGGIGNQGQMTIKNSTIADNKANSCGGIMNISETAFSLTVINSIISENSGGNFGGIAHNSYSGGLFDLTITNSTISGNKGSVGGILATGNVTINNSIIAGNHGEVDTQFSYSNLSASHNIIGVTEEQNLVDGVDGNQVGTSSAPIDPMLSDWSQFKNGLWGYYLLPGSPAINAGDNDLAVDENGQNLTNDRYGNPRITDTTIDIGAIESDNPVVPTEAQNYLVTSLDDIIAEDGILTFLEAFQAANHNQPIGDAPAGSFTESDTIQFDSSLFAGNEKRTILVDRGPLVVYGDLAIEGPDDEGARGELLTFDASGQNCVFQLQANASVSLSNITITGGSAIGSGGGIYNDGDLTLTNATVSDNSAQDSGGGIYSDGTITITDCTISENIAYVNRPQYETGGGGIFNRGEATVAKSTISNNSTNSNGGGVVNLGDFRITNSTISENSINNNSIQYQDGGGIYNCKGSITISNSTIARNTGSNRGGGVCNGSSFSSAALTIINSTIAGNSTDYNGGGIYNQSDSSATLNNSLVADNVTNTGRPDIYCSEDMLSGSYNLIGDGAEQTSFVDGVDGNQVGSTDAPIDPLLSDWSIIENGQWGYYLLPGSPVIDAGDNALALDPDGQALTADVAGNPRISGDAVDIGSIEGTVTLGNAAQTYVVTSLEETIAEDGVLTFVEAFQAANTNQPVGDAPAGSFYEQDTITFADDLFAGDVSQVILVDDGQLTIKGNLSIQGPDADLLAFDATGQNRVFFVLPATAVNFKRITITGGSVTDSLVTNNRGGGIYNRGNLTIAECIISSNAANFGGGIYNHIATISITDSQISGNSATSSGGGILNSRGSAILTNSIIQQNSASNAGGGFLNSTATAKIIDSSIVDNSASKGGGLDSDAGRMLSSSIEILNSVISGNFASNCGGAIFLYSYSGTSELIISNSTLSENSTDGDGGGIYLSSNTATTLNNTIIAGNSTLSQGPDIYRDSGTLTASHNLIGDGSNQPIKNGDDGNQVGTAEAPIDPKLGGWGQFPNGLWGYTLLSDSPAIDAGDDALAVDADNNPLLYDISGNARIQNDSVDIGAYESYGFVIDTGGPYETDEGGSVTFDASGSTNEFYDLVSFEWDFDEDGNFDDASGEIVEFTPSVSGELTVRIMVTDSNGSWGVGNVVVTVHNLAPTAVIAPPSSGIEGGTIALDASGSTDPGNDLVSYLWDFNNDGQYDDASGMTVDFGGVDSGEYTIGLKVIDDNGTSDTASVTVNVDNVAPVADAGGPYVGDEGSVITLDASGSTDPGNDALSYEWDLDNDGEYDDATGITADFSTTADDGVYTVGVRVTDNDGATHTDTATVTVENVAPTANAGGPYVGDEGDSITLDASGSTDPGNDTLSYAWDLDNDGMYDDASGMTTSFDCVLAGEYTVAVKVTDEEGAWDVDSVTVQVNPLPPEATMTAEATVSVNDATFAVTYSDNISIAVESIGDGDILVTGPNGFTQYATLVSVDNNTDGTPRVATYLVTSPGSQWLDGDNGTYQIMMVADEVTDTTNVFVPEGELGTFEIALANLPPTAEASDDYETNEGEAITLDASLSTDLDGTVVSYAWDLDNDGEYDDATGATASFSTTEDGVYTVGVQVTDDDGATSTDSATVTVNNVAPTADAGGPYAGDEGSSVTLDASNSFDQGNDIALYEWDLDNDGQYDDASGSTITFSSTEDGLHTVGLKVTDDDGATSTDSVTVTINNVAPTADAGGPYESEQETTITLDASGSTDPADDIVSYAWDFDGDGEYDDASGITVDFSLTEVGDHTIGLMVTDDAGETSTDTATVTVNNLTPVADAGGPYTVNEGDSITLDASSSHDQGGTIVSYAWDLDGDGVYDDAFGDTPSFSSTEDGEHLVAVMVTDNDDTSSTASTTVTVLNVAPMAEAGGPYTVDQGQTVPLYASGSSDPGDDIVAYDWDFEGDGVYDDASGIEASYLATQPGVHSLFLKVTDSAGAIDTDEVLVTVNNVAPTADAGGPYTVDQGDSVTLNASASTDPGNDIVEYRWDLDGDQIYTDASGSTVDFSRLASGVYTVSVQVVDEEGEVGTTTTTVTVNNVAPTADAGGPYNVDQLQSTTLSAAGSTDPGDDIVTYEWDLDNDGQYDDASGITTDFNATEVGEHTIGLRVTDADGATDTTTATITVNNLTPTADAGGPYTVDEGTSVTLDASGSHDQGGTIVSYAWDLDNDGQYDDASGVTADFMAHDSGSHTVGLMVADSHGATDTTTATITVNNVTPTADAGGPYSVDQGKTVTLDASASTDPGNDIVTYEWDLDNDGQYDNASDITADFSAMDVGTHTVGLRVTDADGASDTTTATVIVNNLTPTADAGGPYTVAEGDSVTLNASASTDPSDDIVSYEWDLDNDGQYDDASGVTADFTQTASGLYSVAVRVTNGEGFLNMASTTVTVNNIAPTADAGGPYNADQGDALTLDASGSTDPGSDIVSYEWDFDGDGQYDDASGETVQFPTSTAGTFTAAVKVTDADGDADVSSTQVTVWEHSSEVWGTVQLNLRDLDDTKDLEWIDEWGSCWVEVWATGSETVGIGSFNVELDYMTDCFTPELAMTQAGGNIDAETLSVTLDPTTGHLHLTGSMSLADAGQGSDILLAKIAFTPTPGESVLPRDTDGKYLKPVADAGFQIVNAELTQPNSTTISPATIVPHDAVPLWPVIYDLNGDSEINLRDIAKLLNVYRWSVGDDDNPTTWLADLDHSGTVDLRDLSYILTRFRWQKNDGTTLTYPKDFPFTTPEPEPEPVAKTLHLTATDQALAATTTWPSTDFTAIAKDLTATQAKKTTTIDELFASDVDPYSVPE